MIVENDFQSTMPDVLNVYAGKDEFFGPGRIGVVPRAGRQRR